MKPPFSPAVKELILKARIVSFTAWQSTHPAEILDLFQTADDNRVYLTPAELDKIESIAPQTSQLIPVARMLADRSTEIIDEARAGVLDRFPTITAPGGGLYPPERAEACWRDFWQFLRCVTYGIAGNNLDYTSDEGFEYMRLLYIELAVPLDAMVVGLEGLKQSSLSRLAPELATATAPYFDRLIDKLRAFKSIDL
jgi:hypothetical protein